MITVYTHSRNPFTKEFWKWVARKIIRKFSGPDAVRESLLRGLNEHGIPYVVNPFLPRSETVIVLSGTHALQTCIAEKRAGNIKKLIAGPNIVAHPTMKNSIIKDTAIDAILLPSQWTIDFWKQEAPDIADKLTLWPAGVEVNDPSTRNGEAIVYDKRNDTSTALEISQHLRKKNIRAVTLTYGHFNQKEYFNLLKSAPFMIYISEVESQGLALQEAWSRNVPTFVAFSGHFTAPHGSWDDPKINAPYLSDELGGFFKNTTELDELIRGQEKFNPKKYCDGHLSDRASVERIVNILQ